jgi:hypothetical protein
MLARGIRFAFRDFANAAQFVFPALGHAVAMLGQEQAHRRETKVSGTTFKNVPDNFVLILGKLPAVM